MNFFFIKIILLCFTLSLTACFKKNKNSSAFNPKNTLFFSITTEPPTLDWNKSTDTTSSLIITNIMEGLLDYDFSKKQINVKPALATKWTSSLKGKRWTFTLKKNVKWTDGKPFKASQIIDGWERLLNPNTASEYAYFLYSVKNAKAYNTGKLKDFSKVGVFINKKNQLVVDLEKPKNYFPYLLTHSSTYPIRKDIIKKYKNHWTDPANIVTLGAYRLKTWEHEKQLILQKNIYYHNKSAFIKNIFIRIIPEKTTSLNLFEKHKLDVITDLPTMELHLLKKKKEYRSHNTLSLYFYGINTKKKPFDDVRVRKAFSLVINKKQIVNILKAGHVPLGGFIPKGLLGYDTSIGLGFNPKKAQQLMDQAGYKDRATLPKITISYNTHKDNKKVAEKIQAQLKKHLNINIELANLEWKNYLQLLKTKKHQIYRMGWVADYPDPDNFMTIMSSDSANNHIQWNNLKYDALISKASGLEDQQKRLELYIKAQKILVEEDAVIIPLFLYKSHLLISNRIKYFPINKMSIIYFKEVSFY